MILLYGAWCYISVYFTGTDIIIRKGEEVLINVAGFHSDPKYYPNPEAFNPENFSKEAKEKRHP